MSSIENINSLLKKLAELDSEMETDIMLKVIKRDDLQVQKQARLLAPFSSGNLRRSIKTKEEVKGTSITGTVYTNLEYAMYNELGTGPIGQANHQGISPKITPRYSQKGWVIPADEISEKEAEMYHFKAVIKNGEVIGYYTKGQPARPFLYPALKDQEKILEEMNKKYILKRLKELCKE